MKRFVRFLTSIAFIGAAISAFIYYLHKRGILRVEINYDNKEGQPVSRKLDEIVETTAGSVGEKVTNKVASMASDVKSRIEHQLGLVSEQLGNITVPSTLSGEDFPD
jgi:hypothetical protein